MEKDFGSWFHRHHTDRQLPDLNCLSAPFKVGQQNFATTFMNSCTDRVSTDVNVPELPFYGLSHLQSNLAIESRGWFYCLPRFRQAFTPLPDSVLKEKVTNDQYEKCGKPILGSECAQKRFLVFDQCGDQTALIYSSGGAPVQCSSSWTPKPLGNYVFNGGEPINKSNEIYLSGPNLTDEIDENHGNDAGSEMREDTEEINALLFSDDDGDYDEGSANSEDDEVTSTGHSPSTMTAYDKLDLLEGTREEEEVASSAEPTKRQKLLGGGYDLPSVMDTATSVRRNICIECEDDAESACANVKNHQSGKFDSLLDDMMPRKEKIRETLSILRNMIPGGKGKDGAVVIDEAVRYLRSLKRKAESLGLANL